MPDRTRRWWTGVAAVYVVVPALVVGLLSALVYLVAPVDVRVSGTVSLSVLAGNEYAYKLNAYASDLDEALASPQVVRAVDEALGPSGHARGLRAERGQESSEVALEITATGKEDGAAALLAAGRTALRLLALQRQAELADRERSAAEALQARLAAGESLADPAQDPDLAVLDLLRNARERAVDRAVADLADVQADLSVVRELLASDPVPGVSVDGVVTLSPLDRALRTSVSGGLAAAFIGATVLYYRSGGRALGPPAGRSVPSATEVVRAAGTTRRRDDPAHPPGGATTEPSVDAPASP